MSMYHCTQCLENHWSKVVIDNTVIATCEMCGYEVHFSARKPKKITEPLKIYLKNV